MSHHVLVLGGHGKIAQLLTPLLLKRSWTVTSVIRSQEQVPTIEKLGANLPGKLNVLVTSIEDISNKEQAQKVIDDVKPDYIAWSAGAGGKGAPERTFKVDRDAAIHFVNAAADTPSVSRFLLVSYLGSRREAAPWWSKEEWDTYNQKINFGVLANYYQAKIAADEVLYNVSRKSTLVGINLRPGTLSDEPAGKVTLGKTEHIAAGQKVSRESVAQTADALLAAEGVKNSWLDLLDGNDDVEAAVEKAVRDGVDAAEGEPIFLGQGGVSDLKEDA